MSDYLIDADPIIPTGVPATPVEVGLLLIAEVVPAESLPALSAEQQPTAEDLGVACVESPVATEQAVAILESAGLEVVLPE